MNINEIRAKRATLVNEGRGLLDRAEHEKRDLSQEEQNQWDRIMAEVDRLAGDIDRQERQRAADDSLGRSSGPRAGGATWNPQDDEDDDADGDEPLAVRQAVAVAERASRERAARPEIAKILRTKRNGKFVRAWTDYLRSGGAVGRQELRDLQADLDVSGGYLRPDQQFVANLIKFVDDFVYIRQLATVMTVMSADSLGIPVYDTDIADADWTNELATGTDDTAMAFGRRELRPHPLAKRVKLSRKLLRQSAIDVEAFVRSRLGYKFGVTQEKAFLNGTGAQQPLGVFTASASGISTARDVSTGNTTTAIQADNLIEVKYSIKAQYWPRARWIFHRDALKQIRKLKDGDGQYLWTPGVGQSLTGGSGDRIIELPFLLSEFAPNTFTTGKYVGILGDFSFYQIADALSMEVQLLNELYAEQNQVGLIARMETDGAPVLEEAFARVKLA